MNTTSEEKQAGSSGTPFPHVQPEDVGLSSERLDVLRAMFSREIDAQRMPGCVIGIMRAGQLAWLEAIGH
ncbi:MAG TPA: hypothetical protein VMX97_05060, partial [Hyphomicrobiaceae bacterium]|nr:hypothetical protein [Hyphomicrobiaceae bacterium]